MYTADQFTLALNKAINQTAEQIEIASRSHYLESPSVFSVDHLADLQVLKQFAHYLAGNASRIAEMSDAAIEEMVTQNAAMAVSDLLDSYRNAAKQSGGYGNQYDARCRTQLDRMVVLFLLPYISPEVKSALSLLKINLNFY